MCKVANHDVFKIKYHANMQIMDDATSPSQWINVV